MSPAVFVRLRPFQNTGRCRFQNTHGCHCRVRNTGGLIAYRGCFPRCAGSTSATPSTWPTRSRAWRTCRSAPPCTAPPRMRSAAVAAPRRRCSSPSASRSASVACWSSTSSRSAPRTSPARCLSFLCGDALCVVLRFVCRFLLFMRLHAMCPCGPPFRSVAGCSSPTPPP